MLVSAPSRANEPSPFGSVEECTAALEEIVASADKAITDCVEYNKVLESSNTLLQAQLKQAQQDNIRLMENQNAWYRNPLTVGTLGIVLGLVGGLLITK
jgi:hypothetical protein